jgi:hypothetical protein
VIISVSLTFYVDLLNCSFTFNLIALKDKEFGCFKDFKMLYLYFFEIKKVNLSFIIFQMNKIF